jgi:hypothetical protein
MISYRIPFSHDAIKPFFAPRVKRLRLQFSHLFLEQ